LAGSRRSTGAIRATAVRYGVSGELRAAISESRRAFIATAIFSCIINILMLAGPLFMLQVYDRVMSSGSLSTLVALSALTAAIYGIIGLLELIRSRIITRVGVDVDRRLGDRVFESALRKSLMQRGLPQIALRELDNLRNFVAGPGPLTVFDAPWTPIYLLVVFMLHWWLGIAALVGAGVLLILAGLSESRSKSPLAEATKSTVRSMELAETGQRNAEAILAMGMLKAYRARWQAANQEALGWQIVSSDRLGSISSATKAVRLLLQSMMLAIGAALALKNEISAGTIVASTIIFGRALSPVEQAISQWRSFVKARGSISKLEDLLKVAPAPEKRTRLPVPKGRLEVSGLRVATPETRQLILAGLTFQVHPGQVLAVIGPSASGKSTLARALVGLWEPFSGTIKIDGATLDQWEPDELGKHIGYLPQDVELFAGTVRQNVARFRDDIGDEAVIAAARMAHAHDLILSLPKGYDTELGAFGLHLSAGQRQRIALARALLGSPALVVLDEPNANLDRAGDEALSAAMDGMRKRGQAVVVVSHRVQAISKSDLLLYVEKGTQRAFGPRADVLKQIQGPPQAAPAAQPAKPARPTGENVARPEAPRPAATGGGAKA